MRRQDWFLYRPLLPIHLSPAGDCEQPTRLGLNAELGPGKYLAKFFESAESAGQGHEAVGEVGHQRLALMHRLHDVQLGQSLMGYFSGHERFWYDADDGAVCRQYGVGESSHKADVAGAENDFNLRSYQNSGQDGGCFLVGGVGSQIGTAKNTNSPDVHSGRVGLS